MRSDLPDDLKRFRHVRISMSTKPAARKHVAAAKNAYQDTQQFFKQASVRQKLNTSLRTTQDPMLLTKQPLTIYGSLPVEPVQPFKQTSPLFQPRQQPATPAFTPFAHARDLVHPDPPSPEFIPTRPLDRVLFQPLDPQPISNASPAPAAHESKGEELIELTVVNTGQKPFGIARPLLDTPRRTPKATILDAPPAQDDLLELDPIETTPSSPNEAPVEEPNEFFKELEDAWSCKPLENDILIIDNGNQA